MEKLLVKVVEVSKVPSVETKMKVGSATTPFWSPGGVTALRRAELYLEL